MTVDPELDTWRRQWQAREAVPEELRRRVEREVRSARYALVLPLAVTVLFGGGTLVAALVSGRRDAYVLTTVTWTFIAITWLTSCVVMKRIGHSREPVAATTKAFIEFAIQACRGKRAAIVAASVLYPIFLVVMLVWRYQTFPVAGVVDYLLAWPVLAYAVITAVLAVLGLRAHRSLGTELHRLRAMRRQFDDHDDAPRD